LPNDFLLADIPLRTERKKKRRYKLNNKHWAQIAKTAKVSDKPVTDFFGGGLMTFQLLLRIFQLLLMTFLLFWTLQNRIQGREK
jgi:hypothetical protein